MIRNMLRLSLQIFRLILIGLLGGIRISYCQVIPTNEWVHFYSEHSLFAGKSIPAGAVIDAYDPDGIHCGTFKVHTEGQYGFLFVYRDDALTPDIDEGAAPGDTITLKVNGRPAKIHGPDTPIWTHNGDILEVNLSTNASPVIASPIEDIILREDDPEYNIADLDSIFSDVDGDSLSYSSQSNRLAVRVSIDEAHRLLVLLASDWFGDAEIILCASDGEFQVQDTLGISVLPVNDPPQIDDLPDIRFSNDSTVVLDLDAHVSDIDDPDSMLHWIAEVEAGKEDSLRIVIAAGTHLAEFRALNDFHGIARVVFIVSDDSLASDRDSLLVQVESSTGIDAPEMILPTPGYVLFQNYPNPFNSRTTIFYQVPEARTTTIKIIDTLGREVATLIDGMQEKGRHTKSWEPGLQTSGIYFLQMKAGVFSCTRKLLLLR